MNNEHLFLELNARINAEKCLWIQGPGGNTSMKVGDRLTIKASGTRIRELNSMEQFAVLNLPQLKRELTALQGATNAEAQYKVAIEQSTLPHSPRPSMESGFHAWLPGQYVLHFHSLAAIGLCAWAKGDHADEFTEWYQSHWQPQLGSITIIDACLPGLELTTHIMKAPLSPVYWLQNHGVILQIDDPQSLALYQQMESEALAKFLPEAAGFYKQWHGLETQELAQQCPELLTAKLRFYFPDLAIMYPRIAKHLTATNEGQHHFVIDSTFDRDTLENWLACSMLQKMFPNLAGLPEALCEAIPNLPTEVARKQVMEKKP